MGGGSEIGSTWVSGDRTADAIAKAGRDGDKAERQKRLAETRKTSAAKARENKPKKVERVKL